MIVYSTPWQAGRTSMLLHPVTLHVTGSIAVVRMCPVIMQVPYRIIQNWLAKVTLILHVTDAIAVVLMTFQQLQQFCAPLLTQTQVQHCNDSASHADDTAAAMCCSSTR